MPSAPSASAALVSYRQFARLANCSEKTVRNGVKSGALPRTPDCLLPAGLANSPWRARGVQRADVAETSAPSLAEEMRRREIALARLRRQQLAQRAAAWVDRAIAADGWTCIVADVRARLLQIAPAAAPQVVGKKPPEIQAVLAATINQALDDLSSPDQGHHDEPVSRDEPAVGDDWTSLEAEKAKIAAIRRSHELTIAIQAGEMVNIEAFAAEMVRGLSNLRTGLINLQAVLPPQLFLRDRAAAEKIIEQALADLIADLPGAEALLRSMK